jgi:hypothetical protein
VFLGQAERQETKMNGIGGLRPKHSLVARVVPPGLFWPLWPPSLTSRALKGSRDKILKSHVNLSLGRFLKPQNTQNGVFLF